MNKLAIRDATQWVVKAWLERKESASCSSVMVGILCACNKQVLMPIL